MKKGIRITIYIILALVLFYFGAEWFLGIKIKNLVEKKVAEMTSGGVRAEIGSVSLHLIGRSLYLKNVKISSDTTALNRSGLPLRRMDGYFKRLGVKGIRFRKEDSVIYLRAKRVDTDLSRLSAVIMKQDSLYRFPGRKMSGLQVKVETVDMRAERIYCRTVEGRDSVDYRLNDFVGQMTDGEFCTHSGAKDLSFICRRIELALESFQYRFAEGASLLEIDSLRWQGEKGRFALRTLRLLPQYGMYEFARKAPGHPDWTRIEIAGLQGTGVDWQRFMTEKWIDIDSISLQKVSVRSFKNRQIEQVPAVKRLFYESVQQFPLPLSVRRIALQQADVEYLELAKHGLTPGRITFNGLQGMIYDLTNRGTSKQAVFTLKAQGKLMNQGNIQAVFRLPADRSNSFFEVTGSMGAMNLSALNPMIEPLAKIKIVSGRMEGMTFQINGDLRKADVDMIFRYEKLRIRIMKEKDGELQPRSFLTTLVNGLIVRENNPANGGLRKVDGSAQRDPNRSQFNYLWKTLFAGLKNTVGL